MFNFIFTLKMHYRDVSFIQRFLSSDNGRTKGVIADYVTENKGNICARLSTFNVKIISIVCIK